MSWAEKHMHTRAMDDDYRRELADESKDFSFCNNSCLVLSERHFDDHTGETCS